MKIVLDCNVLIVSIPSKSPYNEIYRKIVDGTVTVIVSNEILLEYFEVLTLKTNHVVASDVVDMLIGNPATVKAEPFYQFNLITADADDNKYADAAISNNADYLVTNDAHFNILKRIDFPKVNVFSAQEIVSTL